MMQPDEMDLTLYLQTEGRRLAAELARERAATAAAQPPSPRQPRAAAQAVGQHPRPARSLSEALQRMGVAAPRTRRL